MFAGALAFNGGAEVGSGLLVAFAEGPAGKLELAGGDGSPVGRIGGAVVLAGAVVPGPEVAGVVSFAALVTFAEGEAEAVALADAGAAPLSEGPGEAVGAVALPVADGAVPLKEVGTASLSEGPGEVTGAVPLPAEDEGAVPDAVVSLPGNGVGAVVLPGAGAVAFVGSGSAKVVEFSDTIMLVAVDSVPLVGTGAAGVVEFNGTEPLVEGGTDTVTLLGAIPEVGSGELTPLPDGGSAEAVPLLVGKGGDVVDDPGSGGKDVSPAGRGAKTVLELAMMIRLVAAADPLMLMVVTPVIAPTDEISLSGTEAEDSLLEGGGATTVVEVAGTVTLETGAVPLATMVVRLPVITPGGGAVVPEPVGNGATTVVELRGTITLLAAAVPVTNTVDTLPGIPLGPAVVLANGGEDGIPEALGDNDGGSGGVTVVTDGPGEGPESN
jgi:hypothetical protein